MDLVPDLILEADLLPVLIQFRFFLVHVMNLDLNPNLYLDLFLVLDLDLVLV